MRTWEVAWTFAAEALLRELPMQAAQRVDAAVLRFAATGDGEISFAGGRHAAWLRVDLYVVRLQLDAGSRTMTVLYVWRSDR